MIERTIRELKEKASKKEKLERDEKRFREVQNIYKTIIGLTNVLFQINVILYPAIITSLQEEHLELAFIRNSFNLIFNVGALVGILISSFLNTFKLSRILFLTISTVLSLIGLLLMSFSVQYFILGRFICGLGMGIHSITVYYYSYECIFENKIKEDLPNEFFPMENSRPFHEAQMAFYIGTLLTLFFGWTCQWQLVLIIAILVNVAILGSLTQLPESPYCLIYMKDVIKAEDALRRLTNMDTIDTQKYMEKLSSDVATMQENEVENLQVNYTESSSLLTGIYIAYELSGITLFYSCMSSIIPLHNVSKIIMLCMFLYYSFTVRSSVLLGNIHLADLIRGSSTSMSFYLMLLGLLSTVQWFAGNYIILNFLKIVFLQGYFKAYSNGWVCGQHILFSIEEHYYFKIKRLHAALICKYLVLIALSILYIQYDTGIIYLSYFFGVISLLISYTIPQKLFMLMAI